MNTETTTPHGHPVCNHNDERKVMTWWNGVETRICNVCNQTHIVTPV